MVVKRMMKIIITKRLSNVSLLDFGIIKGGDQPFDEGVIVLEHVTDVFFHEWLVEFMGKINF